MSPGCLHRSEVAMRLLESTGGSPIRKKDAGAVRVLSMASAAVAQSFARTDVCGPEARSWRSRSPLAAPVQLREPVRAGDGVALLWAARECMVPVDGAWETWVVRQSEASVLSPQHTRSQI
jgi:hypothetical protein